MPRKILSEEERRVKDRLIKLRSMFRRAWSRDSERYNVLNEAKRAYKGSNKRQKVEYRCAGCGNYFKGGDVSVDHIKPVGTLTFENIGEWVVNLFCFKEELQVLCLACHNRKTNEERRKNNA